MAGFSQDSTLVQNAVNFTKNDTAGNALAQMKGDRWPQAVQIGGTAGANVKFRLHGGVDWIFYDMAPGLWHSVPPFDTIYETGTEATEISIGVPFR